MHEPLLRHLEPFTALDRDALSSLARHARPARIAAGRRINRAVDSRDDWLCYLLDGGVRLCDGETVRARTTRARLPVLGGTASAAFAITLEPCRVLWVRLAPVSFLFEALPPPTLHVTWLDEGGEGGDWQERFLRRGLMRGAPSGLARLFAALEPIKVAMRTPILQEGEPGRDFFVVARGRVELRRRDGFRKLLEPGDVFGEDAILGDGCRNASAWMPDGGRLMRLSEAEFRGRLLPALVRVKPPAIAEATVIDLDRPPWQSADARAWVGAQARGEPDDARILIVGGMPDERLRWAFFAARLGEVFVGD